MRGALDVDGLAVAIAPAGAETRPVEWLRSLPGVREAVVLATCHRTELYTVGPWRQGFRPAFGLSPTFRHTGALAAHHLFRVACGLDSPILGDGQVLAQVRRAYLAARDAQATGALLNRLFETALSAGKRVRHETDLGRGATTTAAAAVGLAERLSGGLGDKHVLIVGAGQTGALASRHAAHRRPARLTIANRTLARARVLATKHGGFALDFDALASGLANADVIIAATAAPDVVISAAMLAGLLARRPMRPLVAIDLAVPCDIEPACSEIHGVTRVGLESVEASTTADRAVRRGAVPEAEALAAQAVREFTAWVGRRTARPTGPVLKTD